MPSICAEPPMFRISHAPHIVVRRHSMKLSFWRGTSAMQKGKPKALTSHPRKCGHSMATSVLSSADVTALLSKKDRLPALINPDDDKDSDQLNLLCRKGIRRP